jgi:hypothetical protein
MISELGSVDSSIFSPRDVAARSEDSLGEAIWSFVSGGGKGFSFLDFIQFEFSSQSGIFRFASDPSLHLDEMTWAISSSTIGRLVPLVSPEPLNDHLSNRETRACPHDKSGLDGIISHLTRKFGDHVQDTGVVGIASSDECS